MKEKIKTFFKERKELLVFVGVLSLIFTSVILIASLTIGTEEDTPQAGITIDKTDPSVDVNPTIPVEVVKPIFGMPVDGDAIMVRSYYDSNKSTEELETAIINNGNYYTESTGVSYANQDDSKINVYAIYDGRVIDIIESESYGTLLVIDHGYDVKSRYSSLEEVKVSIGDEIQKGDLIGVGGTSIFDIEASNHVMLEVLVNNQNIDPATVYNKDIEQVSDMQKEEK